MKKWNLRSAVEEVKTYWNKPPEGKYIPYQEFVAYSVGGIGVNTINSLFGYVALTANCLLLGRPIKLHRWILLLCPLL